MNNTGRVIAYSIFAIAMVVLLQSLIYGDDFDLMESIFRSTTIILIIASLVVYSRKKKRS